jgi:hypothetical protein
VRREIEAETDRETGKDRGISERPIRLSVYSANVLNLTIIDLPGITRVAVGDQPKDIEHIIRRMLLNFIEKDNCLVLAVQAANTDLANSDALQLAKSVDPTGERTIGVITKLDLMDKGTDAMEALQGNIIPLKLGYIGVVNRSQADINSKKDIKTQWAAEKSYFEGRTGERAYVSIADTCGTAYLTKALNRLLVTHIKKCLPEIQTNISKFLKEKEDLMKSMEELGSEGAKQGLVLKALTEYCAEFSDVIDGNLNMKASRTSIYSKELVGGARIRFLMSDIFVKGIQDIDFTKTLSMDQLQKVIRNTSGISGGLFIPDKSFQVVIARGVRMLEEPCIKCVQDVATELNKILDNVASDLVVMGQYNELSQRVVDTAKSLLQVNLKNTLEFVKMLIEMELASINIDHPDFRGSKDLGGLITELQETNTQGAIQNSGGKSSSAIPQFKATASEPYSGMMEVKDLKVGYGSSQKKSVFVVFGQDRVLKLYTDTSRTNIVNITGSGIHAHQRAESHIILCVSTSKFSSTPLAHSKHAHLRKQILHPTPVIVHGNVIPPSFVIFLFVSIVFVVHLCWEVYHIVDVGLSYCINIWQVPPAT